MRNYRSLYTKVGLFVLISIVIFISGIFIISGDSNFFEKTYTVKTHFSNTAGLLPGAYVRLSGVKIGTVANIKFPETLNTNLVEVYLVVNKDGMKRINSDALATIKTEGLLGAKYIEIVQGEEPIPEIINEDMVIESYTPPELQELIDNSDELLSNLTNISKDLNKIVAVIGEEENLENIRRTLNSVRASSEALRKTLVQIERGDGVMHSLIYEEKTSDDLNEIIANLREITELLRNGEGTIGALLIDPSIYDKLNGVLGEAERSKFVRTAVKYLAEENANKSKEEQDSILE